MDSTAEYGRPPPGGAQEGLLENRLRNMILSNNPPGNPHPDPQAVGPSASAGPPPEPTQAGPKTSRGKRPNQAQRRQMNAQFSIPIDTRATVPWPDRQSAQDAAAMRPRTAYRDDFHSQAPEPQQPQPFAPHGSHQHSHVQGRGQGPRHQQFGRGHAGQPAHFAPRGGPGASRGRPPARGALYNPHGRRVQADRPEDVASQVDLLEGLCNTLVAGAEIERSEIAEKEAFRIKIEGISRQVITQHEALQHGRQDFIPESVALKCFGSLASGFATKASDMDLGLISPLSEPQPYDPGSAIPRLVEKAFLEHGFGARLLTRTRVPIIKVCEKPPAPLMEGLLEARMKWESGVVDAPEAAEMEDDNEETAPEDHQQSIQVQSPTTRSINLAATTTSATTQPETQTKSSRPLSNGLKLRQAKEQSLFAYHGSAKRLLRDAGGRDISLSNYEEFGRAEYELLLRVCKAFIEGLRDTDLKNEALSYPSLAFPDPTEVSLPVWRSLHGVFSQVEGANLLRGYRDCITVEVRQDRTRAAQEAITQWLDLQKKQDYGFDPLLYTKQLQIGVDKLKKVSSIQLHFLEQEQNESAVEYYDRVLRLLSAVRPKQHVDPADFGQYVIDRYLEGIYGRDLRTETSDFTQNNPGPMTIVTVGRRHRSLQIAKEFENALEKQQYDEALAADIREYIAVLRSPLIRLPGHLDYVVPQPSPRLLSIVSKLANPGKMKVNLPRDPYRDALEFPKSGVGVQCDINFSAHLALQNTTLLRCYSQTDPRVRPLILFIKHWAKKRGINTPYRGTLSSYGYVLMMLHYLVNVAQPFVCPNLQTLGPQLPAPIDATGRLIPQMMADGRPAHPPFDETVSCRGRFVGFWRDEAAIQHLSATNQLNGNHDPIGRLLRGFFEYYAQNGPLTTYPGVHPFDWGREVISIRTPHGIVTKQAKGWTGAKTVIEVRGRASPDPGAPLQSPIDALQSPTIQNPPGSANTMNGKGPISSGGGGEIKEIRNRYLFAIEDPFELDHNVARTVTHKGIVAIRDEFRRAWRIIKATSADGPARSRTGVPEELLQDINEVEKDDGAENFGVLLADLHGLPGWGVNKETARN